MRAARAAGWSESEGCTAMPARPCDCDQDITYPADIGCHSVERPRGKVRCQGSNLAAGNVLRVRSRDLLPSCFSSRKRPAVSVLFLPFFLLLGGLKDSLVLPFRRISNRLDEITLAHYRLFRVFLRVCVCACYG